MDGYLARYSNNRKTSTDLHTPQTFQQPEGSSLENDKAVCVSLTCHIPIVLKTFLKFNAGPGGKRNMCLETRHHSKYFYSKRVRTV